MNYTVRLAAAAQHELDRFHGSIYQRLQSAIRALAVNPRPRGCLKMIGSAEWRIRVGQYRICYLIDDSARQVRVTHVGHRSNIYR
jgi:mRNA interferase RelE/StbE